MSLDYVEARVKEALKLAKGNKIKAQKQVLAWTFEDTKLLHAITKAHLSGIIAYNVERVASGHADRKRAAAAIEKKTRPEKASPRADDPAFGMEILKVVAGNSGAVFGHESSSGAAPSRTGQASKRHEDTMRLLAARSKNNPLN